MSKVDRKDLNLILELGDGTKSAKLTLAPEDSTFVLKPGDNPFPNRVRGVSERNFEKLYKRVVNSVEKQERTELQQASLDDEIQKLG